MLRDLWPHQVEAVHAVASAIGDGGRTSLVGACGIGKTRIGGAVGIELTASGRVLVVVPTIELLVQTLHAYRAASGHALGTVVAVCSDPTVTEIELLEGEPDIVVTTTSDVLADAVRDRRRVTVLSTYASLPVVADAHAHHRLRRWDLVVADEAHRTTGRADGPWKLVHHDGPLPALRRLYMTATPRVATGTSDTAVVSMSDTSIYGTVCWRLPFSRAITMGLLADYRVVVPVVTNDEIHRLTLDEHLAMRLGTSAVSPATLAGQIAVLRTMTEHGVRRAISYHHRIADAREWAAVLPAAAGLVPGGPRNLWAGHVSGAQAPHLRRRVISRLDEDSDELAVVSNARVLCEGVDVPAVDAVVFTRPRHSAIDTIQALGRALRTGGRRDKIATIVVPLLLAEGESPEVALEGSDWEPVWQVLRALRDHDDRLDEQLRLQRMQLGEGQLFTPSREVKLPPWLRVTGIDVPDRFARAITIHAIRSATPSWDEYYGAARAYQQAWGNVDIPSAWVTAEGLHLGSWWRAQRDAYRTGELAEDRIELLENLGMAWNQREENWMRAYVEAKRLKAATGYLLPDPYHRTPDGINLSDWCALQRKHRRDGTLGEERIRLLEEIGFPWDIAAARWMQRYQQAKTLYQRRGSLLRLPRTLPVGRWVAVQGNAYRLGRLSAEQIRLLHEIGIDFGRGWESMWRNTYEELKAFHAETGHFRVPDNLRTVDGVKLSSWVCAQRRAQRDGQLAEWKTKLLDTLGFPWDPRQQQRWNHNLAELAAFVAHHGHIIVPTGPLRAWLDRQRRHRRADTLTDHAAAQLAEIDPLWYDADASRTSHRCRRFFQITDSSWATIEPLIPIPARRSRAWHANELRTLIETIIWKLRTGASWEDINVVDVSGDTIRLWHKKWEKDGTWAKIEAAITLRGNDTT